MQRERERGKSIQEPVPAINGKASCIMRGSGASQLKKLSAEDANKERSHISRSYISAGPHRFLPRRQFLTLARAHVCARMHIRLVRRGRGRVHANRRPARSGPLNYPPAARPQPSSKATRAWPRRLLQGGSRGPGGSN
jgi:hypothetical protein